MNRQGVEATSVETPHLPAWSERLRLACQISVGEGFGMKADVRRMLWLEAQSEKENRAQDEDSLVERGIDRLLHRRRERRRRD